jgi:hypothetical protein
MAILIDSGVNISAAYWSNQQIAVAPDSTFVVVYEKTDGGKQNIFYATSSDSGTTWTVGQLTHDTVNNQMNPVLTIDSSGSYHISWWDTTGIKYVKFNGTEWSSVSYAVSGSVSAPNIVADSNNVPHIVYKDGVNLKYTQLSGSIWSTPVTAVASGAPSIGSPRIAIDSNNDIHLAYTKYLDTDIGYKKYDYSASTWGSANSFSGFATGDLYVDITVDNDNNPHISWVAYDSGDSEYEVLYTTFDGSAWAPVASTYQVDETLEDMSELTIDVDASNKVRIIFSGTTSPSYTQLRLITYDNGWDASEVLTTGDDIRRFPNLDKSVSAGYAYIYNDAGNLRYSKSSDVAWLWVTTAITPYSIRFMPGKLQTNDFFIWICSIIDYALFGFRETDDLFLELPQEFLDLIGTYESEEAVLAYYNNTVKPSIGTAWLISTLLKMIGSSYELKEWFDYGGDSFKFKVTTDGSVADLSTEGKTKLEALLNEYKNERSVFDGFEAIIEFLDNITDIVISDLSLSGNVLEYYQYDGTQLYNGTITYGAHTTTPFS